MTEPRTWDYRIVTLVRAVDGDTYWLEVDLGFRVTMTLPFRLYGYDCPEVRGPSEQEKAAASKATSFASDWFAAHADSLRARTYKDPDSFGRWLGDLYAPDDSGTEVRLGEALRDAGLASIWPTRWRDEFIPAP